MVQLNWTKIAVNDLKSIYEFIAKDSKKFARLQIIRLRIRPDILKKHPTAGKIVPEFEKEGFRELIEGNYRIVYKIVSSERIDILTVHHAARDLSKRKIQ